MSINFDTVLTVAITQVVSTATTFYMLKWLQSGQALVNKAAKKIEKVMK